MDRYGPFWLEFLLCLLSSDLGVPLLLPEPALALALGLATETGVFQTDGREPSLVFSGQLSPPEAGEGVVSDNATGTGSKRPGFLLGYVQAFNFLMNAAKLPPLRDSSPSSLGTRGV